jgi:hypothetical protein
MQDSHSPYAAVDAGLDENTTHEHGETCPCGVDHSAGLGDQWYQMALTFGPSFPPIREAVEAEFTARGLDVAYLDTIADCTIPGNVQIWYGIFADLAMPNSAPHVDFVGNPKAHDASKWMTHEVLQTLRPVSTLIEGMRDAKVVVDAAHVDTIQKALDVLLGQIASLVAIQSNPLVESNYVMAPEQVESDCPTYDPATESESEGMVRFIEWRGAFDDWLFGYSDAREEVNTEFQAAVIEALRGGENHNDALNRLTVEYLPRWEALKSDHDTGYGPDEGGDGVEAAGAVGEAADATISTS